MPQKNEGLSSQEVNARLKKYGANILPEKPPPRDSLILLSQFKSPLVYVLFVAAFIMILLRSYSDAGVIYFAVIVNTATNVV